MLYYNKQKQKNKALLTILRITTTILSMQKPYYDLNTYLKDRFGCRVYKVVLDAGFTCPNRDGTVSTHGCIYCNSQGSGIHKDPIPIRDQVLNGIKFIKNWYRADKIMVYFQAFSNTHEPVEILEQRYKQALCHEDIVALIIGTRPDCIDEQKLAMINQFTKDYEVWIEYGLQSSHNSTLKAINRGHTYEQFVQAVELTKKFPNIKIATHLIFGLPGESKQDMLETVKKIAKLGLHGVKIHNLYIEKNTTLHQQYKEKKFPLLSLDEYVDIVVSALKILPKDMVIQRINGDPKKNSLIAPDWALEKQKILGDVVENLT